MKFNIQFISNKRYFETVYELEYLLTDNYLNNILLEYLKQITESKRYNHLSIIARVETTDQELYALENKHVIEFR